MSLILLVWDGYSQPGLEFKAMRVILPCVSLPAGWLARLKEESPICLCYRLLHEL